MSRYIDADKHLQKLRERRNTAITWELNCDEETKDRAQEAILIFNECISELIDEPTADVRENIQLDVCPLYGGACGYPSGECYDCPRHGNFRENVRGYWKKRKDKPLQNWYQCSNCGAICGETPKYCSECGADMRGEA